MCAIVSQRKTPWILNLVVKQSSSLRETHSLFQYVEHGANYIFHASRKELVEHSPSGDLHERVGAEYTGSIASKFRSTKKEHVISAGKCMYAFYVQPKSTRKSG